MEIYVNNGKLMALMALMVIGNLWKILELEENIC